MDVFQIPAIAATKPVTLTCLWLRHKAYCLQHAIVIASFNLDFKTIGAATACRFARPQAIGRNDLMLSAITSAKPRRVFAEVWRSLYYEKFAKALTC